MRDEMSGPARLVNIVVSARPFWHSWRSGHGQRNDQSPLDGPCSAVSKLFSICRSWSIRKRWSVGSSDPFARTCADQSRFDPDAGWAQQALMGFGFTTGVSPCVTERARSRQDMPKRFSELLKASIGRRRRAWSGELLAIFLIQTSVRRLPASTSAPLTRLLDWPLLLTSRLI